MNAVNLWGDDSHFLRDLFALLDSRLEFIVKCIESSSDPDGMGYFDDAENIFGIGLVASQQYLVSTYGQNGILKENALNAGPKHAGGETVVSILNAAANYWKHVDEWELGPVVCRDQNGLKPFQAKAMCIIETVTPWGDYPLADVLHRLIGEPKLALLLPILEQWRADLAEKVSDKNILAQS